MMKNPFTLSTCISLLLTFSFACGEDSNSSSNLSCDEVCEQVVQVCGTAIPQCTSECASFSSKTRDCVATASSCAGALACEEGSPDNPEGPDAGTAEPDDSTKGSVCLDYAANSEECGGACNEYVSMNPGIFCSRDCSENADCGDGFVCASSSCRPICGPANADDDAACSALGWTQCASKFDGFTSEFFCDNS